MNTYQHRAQLLTELRADIMRTVDHATTLAERARKRGNKTDTATALDLLEALTDALRGVVSLTQQLHAELINQQPTQKEDTQ